MKHLYLMRHAKSSWQRPETPDFDRPLNPRGRLAARRMGKRLAGLPSPDLILCSTARRARETCDLVAAQLQAGIQTRFSDKLYLASADDLVKLLRRLPDRARSVLLIGHNPGLHELALRLSAKGEAADMEGLAAKFPTAAVAEIGCPVAHWRDLVGAGERLERLLLPRDLAGAAHFQ